MPKHTVTVSSKIHRSFRVDAVAGILDVPIEEKSTQTFEAEIPGLEEDFSIGAIIGPSGSGKTTLAGIAFGQNVYRGKPWPEDKAIVDGFDHKLPFRQIQSMLVSVGFSSPPAWVRPYKVLSGGEKFRCDLARAILEGPELVVFDEFTSVVDRGVAQICSAAVSTALRKAKKRFVAVSCHYDIIQWLEPDWVLDTAGMRLVRGRVRRPDIRLEIFRCKHEAWSLFHRHHYMSSELYRAAHCYMATWNGTPVGFIATMQSMGFKGCRRITRMVVLPDYQGVGIGTAIMDHVAHLESTKHRISITFSHPGLVAHCKNSKLWKCTAIKREGNSPHGKALKHVNARPITSTSRSVTTFEYIGRPAPVADQPTHAIQ